MFADYVKMGAKAIALGLGVAVILGFILGFQIPTVDISFISTYMNKVYTIGVELIPFFNILWRLGVALITLQVAVFTARLGLIGIRWVLKVNE